MKLVIIGSDGQIGFEFVEKAKKYNYEVIPLTHKQIEVSEENSIIQVLDDYEFDAIINTSAYHANKAYEDKNPKKHFDVNVFGPFYLARYCEKRDKIFVHFSTDYVFSGNKSRSDYFFNENDKPIPSNLYGASKFSGEVLIQSIPGKNIILRISSVYGYKGCKAKGYDNFVEMIIRKYESGETLEVVKDIFMTTTSAELVVDTTIKLVKNNNCGLFHLVGNDNCSWFDFAKEIFNLMNFSDDKLLPTESAKTKQIIDRGKNTSLSNNKIKKLGIEIDHWKFYLKQYINGRIRL